MSASGGDTRRTWVVKVGSSLLAGGGGLNTAAIGVWAGQVAQLVQSGVAVTLVSSGSIAAGMMRLGLGERPRSLHRLQALAAVGQMGLVRAYESAFEAHGLHTAQVLLTHADFSDRGRYLNARRALRTLLQLNVIPVVNENDTVATDEIRFGDNDTLAALVANLVEAELLVLLTDQPGLFDRDPRRHPGAKLIADGLAGDAALSRHAGPGGALGRGGMLTKLLAAEKAARSGTRTVIAGGMEENVLCRLHHGEALGTSLRAGRGRLAARKQWLAGQLRAAGKLILDHGAAQVLRSKGRSLLPVGVTLVEGDFRRGDPVLCVDPEGREAARGLVNYNAAESRKIIGQSSDRIEGILGYVDEPELIHRDNMVVAGRGASPADA